MTKNPFKAQTHDKRPPPWFRTFASGDLSSSRYFGLSVGERGLLDSMARAFWCEGPLPDVPRLLAALVRLPESEVTAHLTENVRAHFELIDGSLVHRELARQRRLSDAGRKAMSDGGRKGAKIANDQRAQSGGNRGRPAPQGIPRPTPKGPDMNCNDLNCTELLSVGSGPLTVDHEWVSSYTAALANTEGRDQ